MGNTATSTDLIITAKLAIQLTDWESYWRKVDAAVQKECDALREARRISAESWQGQTLR